MQEVTHYPKGSMCMACLHITRNCSHLPFETMQPIRKDVDGKHAVRCIEFKNKDEK